MALVGCGSRHVQGYEWQRPQKILTPVGSFRGCHFGSKTWPTSWPECSSARMPQAKHPAAPLISRQAAQHPAELTAASKHTPCEGPAHHRERPSSTHQWADTRPSHQGAAQAQFHPPGGRPQKQERPKCCSLQKGDHKQKMTQNEKADKYAPDEGTRHKPGRTTK